MSRRLSRDELEASKFYMMLDQRAKTVEVILTGHRPGDGTYYITGVEKDYYLADLKGHEVFIPIPMPEGYKLV